MAKRRVVSGVIMMVLVFTIPPLFFFGILAHRAHTRVKERATQQQPTTSGADVATKFSTDMAGVLSNVTQTLVGVTDAASANAALPKLKGASAQLDTLKGMWAQVPDAAKPAIKTALSTAISNQEKLVGKVAAVPGVGEIIQPPTKEILDKLKSFLA
jgi:hypothetical protein